MRIGRKNKEEVASGGIPVTSLNAGKKSSAIVIIVLITIALIIWVIVLGQKAQKTVTVAVLAENVYKNEVIVSDMLEPYEMLQAEYEKLMEVDENGNKSRRILTWDEADIVIDSFAAYPLQKGTYAEYRSFIKSRVDNSDSVLYTFPGKEIVDFDISDSDIQTFKTFLQPGDRINIQAIYNDTIETGNGNQRTNVFRTEVAFADVMIADLLNGAGNSILDMYAEYNELTAWEQAAMDDDSSFQMLTTPSSLLVALTPDEVERYYFYKSKEGVEFRMTLPQRTE